MVSEEKNCTINTKMKERRVNTKIKVANEDKQKRLPNERDESPDRSPDSSVNTSGHRDVIRQAASDLERGLVDTDLRGTPGVEKVIEKLNRSQK